MKNEKANLLCRKVKQLNIVISEFSKENHEREKQTISLQKKYEKQLDQILINYQTKIQRMLKSFYGQQKYFIDLFRPQFENKVIDMKSQYVKLCKLTIKSFEDYQNNINKLVSEVNTISMLIFKLIMDEDTILEKIFNSMILKIDQLNYDHSVNLQKLKRSNDERILKHKSHYSRLEANNPLSKQVLIKNYIKIQAKDMLTRISVLKQFFSTAKKEFSDFISNHMIKAQNNRKQFQKIIMIFRELDKINNQTYDISNPSIQKINSNSEIEKIIFSNHENNDKKLKTVLSANSVFEFKMHINNEIKELQHLLNETRQNNQREIFERQFQYREVKNLYLRNYSELVSIIKLNLENQQLSKKLDKQYNDEKMKKKIEIEKIKNQLDNEYYEKKEKFENRTNRHFNTTNYTIDRSLFEKEARKYEKEFHDLCNQLAPQNSEDQRQILRIELISQFLKEIEFENKRHSLQMLLFDLKKSSRIAIQNALSNSMNTINLLREAIKRQIEINKQGIFNTTFNPTKSNLRPTSSSSSISIDDDDFEFKNKNNENEFKLEKNRIALRAIKTSESTRTSSLNLQRQLDKQRLELLNFYENKIRGIQNQKNSIKKELIELNDQMNSKTSAIKYKLFSLVETYKQLELTEKKEKQKIIEKINLKYDGQIEALKKSIDEMKSGKVPKGGRANSAVEAKIEKMNWHCEFLNSQLNALSKQLRIAQRSPKGPDQALKAQRRVKSSFQINAFPHSTH